jgi:acetyltransferase-like isoleucine patch superfamily enzyme
MSEIISFVGLLRKARQRLAAEVRDRFQRKLSFGDLVSDRWQCAQELGFGEGSSLYDNVLVIGEVKVGRNVWIGPNVILDGSGGLEIGDNVSISAGVQVYTHHTVRWANSMGEVGPERAPVRIGSGVYIGPQTIVQKGVTIGDFAVVGAMSLVTHDVPAHARAWGVPARIQP